MLNVIVLMPIVALMIVFITVVMISMMVVLMLEDGDAVLVMPVVSSLVMIVMCFDHVCDG